MLVGLKLPGFCMKIVEFIFAIICYGLTYHFKFPGDTSLVRLEIGVVAAVAFPFVILPACMVAISMHPKHYYTTFLDPIFSSVGFICYIVQGAMTAADVYTPILSGFKGTAAMLIITSLIFLGDFCMYFALKARYPKLLHIGE